jgi:hypothetical protein
MQLACIDNDKVYQQRTHTSSPQGRRPSSTTSVIVTAKFEMWSWPTGRTGQQGGLLSSRKSHLHLDSNTPLTKYHR